MVSEKMQIALISAATAAIVGPIVNGLISVLLQKRNEKREAELKEQAEIKVVNLLWGVFEELDKQTDQDFLGGEGFFWKDQLGDEIQTLAREHRDVIDGEIFVKMTRVSSALKHFTFDSDHPDSGKYSADEIIRDACLVLTKLIPKTTMADKEKIDKMKRLNERIRLMRDGVGGFVRVDTLGP